MPNNYLSVLYKHIIQVENKNVGLKVGGGAQTYHCPPQSKNWGAHAPLAPPLPTLVLVKSKAVSLKGICCCTCLAGLKRTWPLSSSSCHVKSYVVACGATHTPLLYSLYSLC